ncbi:MAG: carboxypeptidase regulatory-like domain-containing protein, partial [Planctomycetaceae bacterium]
RSFFESQLSDGREDTPFVGYIVAHGFGDENGARLLPVETVSVTDETGYSIETLLDSIAESNKKHVVLLLECSHFQSNLRLGVQTNEFAVQLANAFDQRRSAWQTDARFQDRSILIVSSTSGYQTAATSNRLSGSPFALSAAYGLAGGSDADFGQGELNNPDGQITAHELARYCAETVANWSLDNRGRLQHPRVMSFGPDFEIAAVDEAISIAAVLERGTSETTKSLLLTKKSAGATEPKAAKPDASGEAKAPGTKLAGEARKAAGDTVDPESKLAAAIDKSISVRELFDSVAVAKANECGDLSRPADLAAHEALTRIELLLAADNLQKAQIGFEQWQELHAVAADDDRAPVDSSLLAKQLPTSVESVLESPTSANIDGLRRAQTFEGELLVPLAKRYVEEDKWSHPEAIRLAAESRRLHQAAGDLEPWAFSLVKPRFEAADQARVRGEVALFDGRFTLAMRHLAQAGQGYRDAIERTRQVGREITEVDSVAASIPWLIDAFEKAALPPSNTFTQFISGLKSFCADPTASRLRRLNASARRLEEFEKEFALKAIASRDRTLQIALLQVPNLSQEIRKALFDAICDSSDRTELRTGHRFSQPTNAPRAVSEATTLLNEFLSGTEAVPGLTTARASASKPNGWTIRMQHTVASYWASTSREAKLRHQVVSNQLARQIRKSQLTWDATCLARTRNALPIHTTAFLDSAVAAVHAIDPEYSHPSRRSNVSISFAAKTEAADLHSIPIDLVANETLPSDADARLVIQTHPARELTVGGERGEEGRVELPLSDLVAGAKQRFVIEIEKSSTPTTLTSSIRLTGGENVWQTLALGAVRAKPVLAKLSIEWPDEGPTVDVAELMPNESLPLRVSVERLDPAISALTVEFVGDGIETVSVPASKLAVVPVVPKAGFRLSLVDEQLTVRLRHAGETIDERTIDATVLDPRQCFRCDVRLDATRNRAIGSVQRLYGSDVLGPLNVRLGLQDKAGRSIALPAAQALRLDKERAAGSFEAALPFSVPQPYRISVDVAGVPRAFRYRLRSNDLTAKKDSSTQLRFTHPADGVRYAVRGRFVVPVKLQVDAARLDAEVFLGIDQNGNGRLEEHERIAGGQYWFGRDARLELAVGGQPASLRLESSVRDIEIPLDLSGYEGYVKLIAAVGENVVATRRVYLVRSAPRLDIVSPATRGQQPAAKSIRVAIQANKDHVQAIDKVEFGFDLNRNGRFDPNELVRPIAADKFKANGRAVVELPTAKLKAGAVTVFARTQCNAVDIDGKPQPFIGEPAAASFNYVTLGTIAGRVQLVDGTPVRGATITIPGIAARQTGADGSYEFKNIKPGTHVLSATGPGRAGSQAVKVQPARLTKADITILVR